jgi:hypothetical protein
MAIPLLGAFPSNKAAVVVDTHANRIASAAMTAGQIWKESDTGLLYLYDGSAWVDWKRQGQVAKTADETVNNSATLQNDDHLFWPIEANERWFFKAFLICQGASANADWLFGWTFPTGATAKWAPFGNNATNPFNWIMGATTSSQTEALLQTQTAALGGRNGTILVELAGWWFAAATAGNIQLQWAQNTATVENNSILTGSFLELTRLP